MKREEIGILMTAIVFFGFIAVKFFSNIIHELSHGYWERAFVALIIFSVTLAVSVFSLLILIFLRRKKRKVN
ncbi:MAG: hypothetical protein WC241_04225 [Candidatus Paceibacterota bacterium]|jgi:hypothetical protein